MNKTRFQFVNTVFIAALAFSTSAAAQESQPIDMTKSSNGISDDNISALLSTIPNEEANTKNELNVVTPALVVGPAQTDDQSGIPGRLVRWRHELVGQKVVVAGIAMGRAQSNPHVMTNQRVIYEGGVIYIRGVDFSKENASGKLVRVTGHLRLEPESIVKFDGHDPVTDHKYFFIAADSVEVMDRVEEPRLIASKLKRD